MTVMPFDKTLQPFLSDMGKYPLLTREEEQRLGRILSEDDGLETLITIKTYPFAEDYLRQTALLRKDIATVAAAYQRLVGSFPENGTSQEKRPEYGDSHDSPLVDRVAALHALYKKHHLSSSFVALVGHYLEKPPVWTGPWNSLQSALAAYANPLENGRPRKARGQKIPVSFSPELSALVEQEPELYTELFRAYDAYSSKIAEVRDTFLLCNIRLVVSTAKKLMRRYGGGHFKDFISEGIFGLYSAVEKFDYSRGYKFSTYAGWWIRQAMIRYFENQGHTIRIPVWRGEALRHIKNEIRYFVSANARKPTPQEFLALMEEQLGLSVEQVQALLEIKQLQNIVSLDAPLNGDTDNLVEWNIPDPSPTDPLSDIEDRKRYDAVEDALSSLTQREETVIRMRFGIGECREHSLEEIGAAFGLTRERIRQIEGKALRTLRKEGHPQHAKLRSLY